MQIIASVRWAFSVGGKVFRVVPGVTLLVVLFTLLSQVAALLAGLLPLKVLILLGSEHIPTYFPRWLHGYGRPTLVLALCVLAVKFFIIHLLAESVIAKLSDFGARTLIARSRKLALFENQEDLLSKAYQRFAGAQAGAVFVALAGVLLLVVYPLQALVIFSYLSLVWIALISFVNYSPSFKCRPAKDLLSLLGVLGSVGFFVTFGCIVIDVLVGSEVSMLWAIVALLLVRQMFRRLVGFISDLTSLYQQRLQLNALLFQGHVYIGKESATGLDDVWLMAEVNTVNIWMLPVITSAVEGIYGEPKIQFVPSGISDVLMWVVEVQRRSGPKRFLVKLFGKSRTALARHEASLFSHIQQFEAPFAQLCVVEQVDSFYCHVFEWPGQTSLQHPVHKDAAREMSGVLFAVRPSPPLVALFTRSRPMLWDRLDEKFLPRLRLFSSESENFLIERFSVLIPDIRVRLQSLPLVVMTADTGPDTIWHDSQNRVWACHWGRWTLEPLGAGWPVDDKLFPMLCSALAKSEKNHPHLRGVSKSAVQLAALVFAFEKSCQRQDYRVSLKLLNPILGSYENLVTPSGGT